MNTYYVLLPSLIAAAVAVAAHFENGGLSVAVVATGSLIVTSVVAGLYEPEKIFSRSSGPYDLRAGLSLSSCVSGALLAYVNGSPTLPVLPWLGSLVLCLICLRQARRMIPNDASNKDQWRIANVLLLYAVLLGCMCFALSKGAEWAYVLAAPATLLSVVAEQRKILRKSS